MAAAQSGLFFMQCFYSKLCSTCLKFLYTYFKSKSLHGIGVNCVSQYYILANFGELFAPGILWKWSMDTMFLGKFACTSTKLLDSLSKITILKTSSVIACVCDVSCMYIKAKLKQMISCLDSIVNSSEYQCFLCV